MNYVFYENVNLKLYKLWIQVANFVLNDIPPFFMNPNKSKMNQIVGNNYSP